MISINSLTVAYGSFTLLDDINFHISEQDKIGLVGKNGAGKSTILKLICGFQTPTSGTIAVPSDVKIGYLPQIMEHHRGRTVLEEALTAFDKENELEEEISRVTEELAHREDYESQDYLDLAERLAELNEHLAATHSEPPEVQARKTLLGLGFRDSELGRPTESFSQGWNMRIELAKILLRQHDVLLLDEPTNHLDIESIEWLEDYLASRKGSLILVSHDRKFLDRVTNRTVEIVLGHVQDENGQKMSKSKGNVVDPYKLADMFGVDALRFFLLRTFPLLEREVQLKLVHLLLVLIAAFFRKLNKLVVELVCFALRGQ